MTLSRIRTLLVLFPAVLVAGCTDDPLLPPPTRPVALADSLADPGFEIPRDPPPVVLVPPQYPPPDDPPPGDPPPVDPPPGIVTGFVADGGTPTTATLRWTVPIDEGGVGRPVEYDLRVSPFLPAEEEWGFALRDETVASPRLPGSIQYHTISGLLPGMQYWFRIRSVDDAGQWSEWSAVATYTTYDHLSAPVWTGDIGTDGPPLMDPWDVAVADDDVVFVSDRGTGFVHAYALDGTFLFRFSCGPDSLSIRGVGAEPGGSVLVVRALELLRYDREGNLLDAVAYTHYVDGLGATLRPRGSVDVGNDGRILLGVGGGGAILDSGFQTLGVVLQVIPSGDRRVPPSLRYDQQDAAFLGAAASTLYSGSVLYITIPLAGNSGSTRDVDGQTFVPQGMAGTASEYAHVTDRDRHRITVFGKIASPVATYDVPGPPGGGLRGIDIRQPDERVFVVDAAAGVVHVLAYPD